MFGMSQSPLAAYAKVSNEIAIETADPHRLILLLFEGAEAAIVKAKGHMERNEIAEKGEAISKAIDIVANGLSSSLNIAEGGELAERLAVLYEYICKRLLWANLKNNVAALDEARDLLSELHGAWAAIAPEKLRAQADGEPR